jgi:hypothetical protein
MSLRVQTEVKFILSQGFYGACIGAVIGLIGKSNVVLATSIVAARNIAQAISTIAILRVTDYQSRTGVLMLALSDLLISTIGIAALKKFDIIGNRFAAVTGGIVLALFVGNAIRAVMTKSQVS